jgi:RNA polymerase sigma factor (sigma-70 family)
MTLDDQKRVIDFWIQFLDGSEIAFSQLYCLFFDDLLTYGRRVGGENEMVEDLIQDLFLKLYQKKIILEDNTKLRPFLFRSLKNMIYNQLLRNAKLQPLSDNDFAFDLNYTIDEQLFLSQDQGLSDEVHRILRGLTGRQKEIIYLRFVHEMSFEEIAEIMEINIQSARNLLTRSMEKLRKEAPPIILLYIICFMGK